MKILFEDCDVDKAEDRTLPNNAFVVEYKVDNVSKYDICLLYTSPSPRDATLSRMPSSA